MTRPLFIIMGLSLLLGASAQGPQIGFCNSYQTTQSFDEAFIQKMQANADGYSFALTSGPTFGCQNIKFFPNGTYAYDFIDVSNTHVNATGTYTATPFSYTSPSSIRLSSLPYGELGSMFGAISLSVLAATEDYIALLSCVNIGLIRTQQLHILIPKAKSASIVMPEFNATIQALDLPLEEYLQEVQQTCAANVRQLSEILFLYRLLVKFGVIPPVLGSENQASNNPTLYAALASPNESSDATDAITQAVVQALNLLQSNAQSFSYPQPTTFSGHQLNSAPVVAGQQVFPQTTVQFGGAQVQNPAVNVYPVASPVAGNFVHNPAQFSGYPSFISPSFSSSFDPFRAVRPAVSVPQPLHVGQPETGVFNAIFQR